MPEDDFNPFKFRYEATIESFQNSYALLRVRKGASQESFYFPKDLLPEHLNTGDSFMITVQPESLAKKEELACMRALLNDLLV